VKIILFVLITLVLAACAPAQTPTPEPVIVTRVVEKVVTRFITPTPSPVPTKELVPTVAATPDEAKPIEFVTATPVPTATATPIPTQLPESAYVPDETWKQFLTVTKQNDAIVVRWKSQYGEFRFHTGSTKCSEFGAAEFDGEIIVDTWIEKDTFFDVPASGYYPIARIPFGARIAINPGSASGLWDDMSPLDHVLMTITEDGSFYFEHTTLVDEIAYAGEYPTEEIGELDLDYNLWVGPAGIDAPPPMYAVDASAFGVSLQ
jgi:hypothetical protein